MTGRGGCFAANLDVEHTWALRAGLRPRALSARARERASALGLLCSVLAPDATALWTPTPIDPARRRRVPGMPLPELVSEPAFPEPHAGCFGDPEAFRVGHRRWAHEHGEGWGTTLESAAFIRSVDELETVVTAQDDWVLKAPYAAAGRHRVLGHGPRPPAGTRGAIERLLAAYEELLLEPWLARVADFGCAVRGDTVSLHRLLVDARGRFAGIGPLGSGSLRDDEQATIRSLASRVRATLRSDGYEGPFGFDAFRYRDGDGTLQLRLLCEVNPRYTFGHIHAALERVAHAAWGNDEPRYTLQLGDAAEADLGDEALSLIGSADGARSHAWLTPEPE